MEGSLSRFNPWCMNPIADKHIGMSYKHGWYMKIDLLSPRLELQSKGQLFSEWIYKVIVSPKIQTKIVKISALTTQGRNPDNFLFVFWQKQWLHKFILKLINFQ